MSSISASRLLLRFSVLGATWLLCLLVFGGGCVPTPPSKAEDAIELTLVDAATDRPATRTTPDNTIEDLPMPHDHAGPHDHGPDVHSDAGPLPEGSHIDGHSAANCEPSECNSPPTDTCFNGNMARSYEAIGTCHPTADKCMYAHKDTTCPSACKAGKCTEDPCKGITCKKAPAAVCIDAKTLRNYYLPGSCQSGKCVYQESKQACPHGCAAGKCKVGAGFSALTPFRFLDTRGSTTPATGSTRCVKIAGKGGIPTSARAVYINLVAVNAAGPGFLTAYPKGIAQPTSSNLNYTTGQTIANGAIVKLGSGGEICVYTHASAHIIIDVSGFFDADADYFPKGPYRRLDTRSGVIPADASTQCHQIAGRDGIPTDAKAIFANFAVVNATGPGHLIVYPKGTSQPITSNLNYAQGQTISNGGVVKIGSGGEICVYIHRTAHLIIDVAGYFGSSSSFVPILPLRRLDTRSGAPLKAKGTQCIQVAGKNGIPSTAKTLAINLAAIAPSAPGFLTIYPNGHGLPGTSSLNHAVGGAIANNAIVQVGTGGKICIYNVASTHYALDVVGYWLPSSGGNPCTGVVCTNAPPTTCVGGKDVVSFAKSGTCKNGTCIYKQTTKVCDYICSGTACVAAPPPPPPPPPPSTSFHSVGSWQDSAKPVSSGSRMDILALRYITIHYNGGNLDLDGKDNVYQDSDFAQVLRNMQHGYVVSRGYSLGYNSAVAPDGDEWEIRGLRFRAAANGCTAVNRPGYAIIVPLRSVSTSPTNAQIQGVKKVIARIRAAAKAAGNNNFLIINGHRDVRPKCGGGGTACPGTPLYNLIKNGTF